MDCKRCGEKEATHRTKIVGDGSYVKAYRVGRGVRSLFCFDCSYIVEGERQAERNAALQAKIAAGRQEA